MRLSNAVILAAGRGARMGSLTADVPKPMLPLRGKPILEHQIERLEAVGIEQVLLITGYKAELVEGHLDRRPRASAAVGYRRQPTPNGTGSAALLARDFVGSDAFLLTFGDILVDQAVYRAVLEAMDRFDAVLTVKRVDDPHRGAAVYTDNDRVTRIVEKPPPGKSETNWINAGIYGFRCAVFDELERIPVSPRGEYELTDAVSRMIADGVGFGRLPIDGFWKDVGRPEDLPAAAGFVTGGPEA